MDVRVAIEICRDGVSLPAYSRRGDAGMDVRAAVDLVLEPGRTAVVPTGLRFAIPEGYEIQVRPRSGLSLHTPLRIPNARVTHVWTDDPADAPKVAKASLVTN